MSETDIQRAIKEALEGMGVWVIRTASAGKRSSRGVKTGEPGIPDLHLASLAPSGPDADKSGWLEIKKPGGRRSEAQMAWHAKAKARGIRAAVVESPAEAWEVVLEWRERVNDRV